MSSNTANSAMITAITINTICKTSSLEHNEMSRVTRKDAFCIFKNKGTDQLCGNREAD